MEDTRAFWGALLLIGMILGVNFMMYGIVRGAARSKRTNFFETMGNMFSPPNKKKEDSMDELRQKVRELDGGRKGNPPDSE
jgi:preprotein translocase subunit Sec63